MKITNEHYQELLKENKTRLNGLEKTVDSIVLHYAASGWSRTRLVWDLFLHGNSREFKTQWTDKVYKYANDDHIRTALNRVAKEFNI